MRKLIFSVLFSLLAVSAALGQYGAGTPTYQSWTMTAKISPNPSITTTSQAIQLPSAAPGLTARICNLQAASTGDFYLVFGTSNAVVATQATGSWLKANTCNNFNLRPFAPIANQFTWLAAICVGTCATANNMYLETGLGAYVPGQ